MPPGRVPRLRPSTDRGPVYTKAMDARDGVVESGMPHEMEGCYERLDALLAG